MELETLKKKISTFRGDGGRVRITDDALLMEILVTWEQWKGPIKDFYRGLGVSHSSMASLMGRAKRLKRDGFPTDGFKEVKLSEGILGAMGPLQPCSGIEMCLEGGKLIRFSQVDQLIDFLKKAA